MIVERLALVETAFDRMIEFDQTRVLNLTADSSTHFQLLL
jgi:hypothetical protein